MAEKREKEKKARRPRKSEGRKRREAAAGPDSPADIRARVIDDENGLRLLTGVYAVRILSRSYNLLLMSDYLPALGKVDGDVTFLTTEDEVTFSDIRGFYKHQHNEFTLLIEEHVKKAEAD